MSELTAEESLILKVAVATCFAFPFEAAEVPADDVNIYVEELLKLYASKPDARTGDPEHPDMPSTLVFCADRLGSSAPSQSARLRAAVEAPK